jgi:hypothetical protein
MLIPHDKRKLNRELIYPTFAAHMRAVRDAMTTQDKEATDDLIENFAIGSEPVRRVSF